MHSRPILINVSAIHTGFFISKRSEESKEYCLEGMGGLYIPITVMHKPI